MVELFKYGKGYWYPHMKPRDIEIWERFMLAYPDAYEQCQYDFAVGDIPAHVFVFWLQRAPLSCPPPKMIISVPVHAAAWVLLADGAGREIRVALDGFDLFRLGDHQRLQFGMCGSDQAAWI